MLSALRDDDRMIDDISRDAAAARLLEFDRIEVPDDGSLKRAAVCLTVVTAPGDSGDLSVIITRRLPSLRSHGGQWALPGGRLDHGETPREAAAREMEEEVGIRVEPANIVGELDDYVSRSGYCITPVVFWDADVVFESTINASEVASLHLISLNHLDVDPTFYSIPESPKPVIQLPIGGRSGMHAPTGAIIHQFREVVLHGRATRVTQYEEPVFAWK
ncbi:CoA pyrophosphatase [soil metagenome]